ncbi:hypothetical protein Tco_1341985 [Tanacetum coccineum]
MFPWRGMAQVDELQDRVGSLACDRKELQEHIRIAIKEHEVMEMMLFEFEEEHDEALYKIILLETELQDLKDEKLQLKEVHGKSQWDIDTQVGAVYGYDYGQNLKDAKVSNPKDEVSMWRSDHFKVTDILMHKDRKFDAHDYVKNDGATLMHQIILFDNVLGVQREVAFSQSLFSAVLSILVGMIIWEAQDPCMPLVAALFLVVGEGEDQQDDQHTQNHQQEGNQFGPEFATKMKFLNRTLRFLRSRSVDLNQLVCMNVECKCMDLMGAIELVQDDFDSVLIFVIEHHFKS